MYQTDLSERELKKFANEVIEDCVNLVGVDVNVRGVKPDSLRLTRSPRLPGSIF